MAIMATPEDQMVTEARVAMEISEVQAVTEGRVAMEISEGQMVTEVLREDLREPLQTADAETGPTTKVVPTIV